MEIKVKDVLNVVGQEFWSRLCAEHGIRPDGILEDFATQVRRRRIPTLPTRLCTMTDSRGTIEKKSSSTRYRNTHPGRRPTLHPPCDPSRPRTTSTTSLTKVINTILQSPHKSLYNPENICLSKDGGGAGNNWSFGYGMCGFDVARGEQIHEEILEMVDREADGSDSLEGFMMMHSIAGGTGSGLGMCLLI